MINHYRNNHYYNHLFQYFLLFLLMVIAFFSYIKVTGNIEKQLQIGIVTGLTYIAWGIYHHLLDRDLNWKIVVEYITIALVGIAMLWLLLSYIF
jgi:hypothetical protein